jgi:hypothetical protein
MSRYPPTTKPFSLRGPFRPANFRERQAATLRNQLAGGWSASKPGVDEKQILFYTALVRVCRSIPKGPDVTAAFAPMLWQGWLGLRNWRYGKNSFLVALPARVCRSLRKRCRAFSLALPGARGEHSKTVADLSALVALTHVRKIFAKVTPSTLSRIRGCGLAYA